MKYDLSKIEFKNEKRYLSNMWKCNIEYEGIIYPSSEHLYQSLKSDNKDWHKYLLPLTPEQTKTAARKKIKTLLSDEINTFKLKDNFHDIKIELMYMIVKLKFEQNPDLAKKLINETGFIEERNCWNDTFWGTVNGTGENHLGNILMNVRDNLDIVKEINDNFQINNRFNFKT